MEQVFSKEWFSKHKPKILWLLNHSSYFRKDLGIQECDLPHGEKITDITPNSFSYGDRPFFKDGKLFIERTTDFRTHDKFGKRLYYGFYPIWNLAHKFDMSVANRWAPAMNLGFDTLTVYPQAGEGGANTTCDGRMYTDRYGSPQSWNTVVTDPGSAAFNTGDTGQYLWYFTNGTTINTWATIERGGFTIDTSGLTSGATISASVFSLRGDGERNDFVQTLASNIYSFAPAANNNFVGGDYDSFGTTAYSSNKTLADWSIVAYNDFTLNATGIAAISKTGITKLGTREAVCDVANSGPTMSSWGVGASAYQSARFADYTGTDNDPKLVVTYSLPVAAFAQSNLTLLGVG